MDEAVPVLQYFRGNFPCWFCPGIRGFQFRKLTRYPLSYLKVQDAVADHSKKYLVAIDSVFSEHFLGADHADRREEFLNVFYENRIG